MPPENLPTLQPDGPTDLLRRGINVAADNWQISLGVMALIVVLAPGKWKLLAAAPLLPIYAATRVWG